MFDPPQAPPSGSQSPTPGQLDQLCGLALHALPIPCALFQRAGQLVYANPAFAAAFGIDPARQLGRRPADWGTTGAVALEAAIAGQGPATPTLTRRELSAPGGQTVVALFGVGSGSGSGVDALLAEIRTTNHAIGNALVGILGYAELLQRELGGTNPSVEKRLVAISSAAQRVDELSQGISTAIRDHRETGSGSG